MDITSPTVDRSQADGPTATRSQQQKAAAVQKAVATRKQRYLACAFPKLHIVAVNVTALRRADRRRSACRFIRTPNYAESGPFPPDFSLTGI
jgi:hypothetical protein